MTRWSAKFIFYTSSQLVAKRKFIIRFICPTILSRAVLSILIVCVAAGCSDDADVVNPDDKLCRSGAGFGARIAGTPQPIEMCVVNEDVVTTLGDTDPNRYEIFASMTAEGVTIEVEVSFLIQSNLPRPLQVTGNQAEGFANPEGVWISYREIKPNDYDYRSTAVTGDCILTFSDESVAVATLTGLSINLEDGGGQPAGQRTISEGFVSVTPDS